MTYARGLRPLKMDTPQPITVFDHDHGEVEKEEGDWGGEERHRERQPWKWDK